MLPEDKLHLKVALWGNRHDELANESLTNKLNNDLTLTRAIELPAALQNRFNYQLNCIDSTLLH